MQHNCHVCSILIQDPEITDITPTQGPKSGGTRVTIFGKYLNAGTVRRACFGNETFECKLIEERYWQKKKTKQNSIFMLPKADQSQKIFLYTVVTLVFMSITFGVYACIVKITVSRAPGFVANDTICTICY